MGRRAGLLDRNGRASSVQAVGPTSDCVAQSQRRMLPTGKLAGGVVASAGSYDACGTGYISSPPAQSVYHIVHSPHSTALAHHDEDCRPHCPRRPGRWRPSDRVPRRCGHSHRPGELHSTAACIHALTPVLASTLPSLCRPLPVTLSASTSTQARTTSSSRPARRAPRRASP